MGSPKSQAPIWFLFLTDLHIKADDASQQRATLQELNEEIRRATLGKRIDFVVIAGDLAYSGKKEEYKLISELLIAPMKQIVGSDVPILAAPGNHDLYCPTALPIQWDALGKARRDKFFSEDSEGQQIRTYRSAGFSNWEAFVEETGIIATRPSIEVTRPHIVDLGDRGRIQVFSTNTALFSDNQPDTQSANIPAPNASIRKVLLSKDKSENTHNIIVGHHPLETFDYQQLQVLKRLLSDHRAIYLHGHTHVMQANFGGEGLLSLGLSAGYMKSADAAPEPIYRNGFALAAIHNELHILLRQWNNESGAWESASGLPVEFNKPSSLIPDGYMFPLRRNSAYDAADLAQPQERASPRITTILTLNSFTPQDMLEVARQSHLLPDIPSEAETKKIETSPDTLVIEADENGSRQRFSFISAPGHILSQEAVERINNDIDYEDLIAYTVISVGHLASEAKTSYLRLKRRKPINIIAENDLAHLLQQSFDQRVARVLVRFDAATTEAEVLLSRQQAFIFLYDRRHTSWFGVLSKDGSYLDEHDEVVRALRSSVPRLAFSAYGDPSVPTGAQSTLQPPTFDAAEYRRKCYAEHNSVRYAALATFGLRLSNTSLEELYISASADYEQVAASESGLRRALEEALQGLGIKDPAVRNQMEAQINRRLRGHGSIETGVARKLYQRFGTVIVLGDPGSGKTLFAKYEMLAYCEEGSEAGSWYHHHVPVYISLAEMARSHNWNTELDVIEAVSSMCGRQGLRFPTQHLAEYDHGGRLAFFFDGLDEIVSLDQRITIFEKICEYSFRAKSRGNRIIITSRPAAVRLLSIPETFRLITLRGLTTSEMRELARRILSAKVSESGVNLTLVAPGGDSSDDSLVETLMQDCQKIPGIGRIARNPLLFTLLTMIYANHGPLAAKRHKVYQQAVQTLASARARSAGQRVFSEADLRRRLGAVALEAYQSPQTVVPSWNQVCETVRRVMERERDKTVDRTGAETFIQEVAEATGLLVLHPSLDREDGGNITFMHQSFMEYYAAVGISGMENFIEFATARCTDARWKEIIVLLAGIVGDSSDITPLIVSIFSTDGGIEKYTLERLLFAFECALENDVPPERTQHALMEAVEAAFTGVLLHDDSLRRDMGAKLAELHQSVAQDLVEGFISRGLRQEDPRVVAAYMDALGHLSCQVEIGEELIGVFIAVATESRESSVLISALNAISESEQLRAGSHVNKLLDSGFRGSVMAKYAAVLAVEKAPSLADSVWRNLMDMIRGDKEYLAVRAANAVICAGWKVSISDDDLLSGEAARRRADQLTALSVLARAGDEAVTGSGDSVSRAKVEILLSSTEEESFLFGVHLLPWVSRSEQFVHDRLMTVILADRRHRVVAAALDSIRMSYDARSLMEFKDLDIVRAKLRDSHRDVRMAACRLLGEFCDDEVVTKAIMDYGMAYASDTDEHCGALAQLGRVAHDAAEHASVVRYLNSQLDKLLNSGDHNSEHPLRSIRALLKSASAAEATLSPRNVRRLKDLHADYRVDNRLRSSVVAHFGDVAPVTEQSARFLIEQARQVPVTLISEHFKSMEAFLGRCSRKVVSIRAVRLELPQMQEAILERLESILRQSPLGHQSVVVSSGRRALGAIAKMEGIYMEVSAQPVHGA